MTARDGRRRPEDDRRISWGTDRDPRAYARRRATGARRRVALDQQDFDPSPPDDDDWAVPDRSQLTRLSRGPETLGSVLDGLVSDRGWDQRLRGVALFDRWDEVVGGELAQHCQPLRLAGGVLTVTASSPAWATQLRYLSRRLLVNVNSALGEPLVTSIHVVVGRA